MIYTTIDAAAELLQLLLPPPPPPVVVLITLKAIKLVCKIFKVSTNQQIIPSRTDQAGARFDVLIAKLLNILVTEISKELSASTFKVKQFKKTTNLSVILGD